MRVLSLLRAFPLVALTTACTTAAPITTNPTTIPSITQAPAPAATATREPSATATPTAPSTPEPTAAPDPTPTPTDPRPTIAEIFPGITSFTSYTSRDYGITFGYPDGWTQSWQDGFATDSDRGSIFFDVKQNTAGSDADVTTPEGLAAWFDENGCDDSMHPCDHVPDQVLPMCFGKDACDPALLMPSTYLVQAVFAKPETRTVTMVALPVGRPGYSPAAALRYGGGAQLLKSILTTFDVWEPEPERTVVVREADEGGPGISVDNPGSAWTFDPGFGAFGKEGEEGKLPEATVMFWPFPAGTEFFVPTDPCQSISTNLFTPLTTPDEFAAALAAQASRDASEPQDVTIDGYAGKSFTVHVPDDVDLDECEHETFLTYGTREDLAARTQQGPGQTDELWILDVNGSTVVIDAMYRPDTPPEHVEEMRRIAESATFQSP